MLEWTALCDRILSGFAWAYHMRDWNSCNCSLFDQEELPSNNHDINKGEVWVFVLRISNEVLLLRIHHSLQENHHCISISVLINNFSEYPSSMCTDRDDAVVLLSRQVPTLPKLTAQHDGVSLDLGLSSHHLLWNVLLDRLGG